MPLELLRLPFICRSVRGRALRASRLKYLAKGSLSVDWIYFTAQILSSYAVTLCLRLLARDVNTTRFAHRAATLSITVEPRSKITCSVAAPQIASNAPRSGLAATLFNSEEPMSSEVMMMITNANLAKYRLSQSRRIPPTSRSSSLRPQAFLTAGACGAGRARCAVECYSFCFCFFSRTMAQKSLNLSLIRFLSMATIRPSIFFGLTGSELATNCWPSGTLFSKLR